MSESSVPDSIKSTSRVNEETIVGTPEGSGVVDGSTPTATLPTITVIACRYGCGRTGIPILPVVFSRDDYRVSRKDRRYFGDRLSAKSAKHDAIASLPTHTYLYCFYDYIDSYGDEQKSVEERFTGKDGALKRVATYNKYDFEEKEAEDINKIEVTNIDEPDDDELDEMVQPALCDRDNHSTLDSKYITLSPGEIVWLMVSHAKLSKSALKKYFYDEAIRDKRMQKFVADDLIDNKNTKYMSKYPPEIEYINSFHQRKQLEQGGDIGDKLVIHEKYSKREKYSIEDGEVEENILKEDAKGAISSAFQLYENMERGINDRISDIEENIDDGYGDSEDDKLYEESEKQQLKILKDTKPMMVALHDPVGEVLAAAEKRNYLLKKLDDAQKNKGQIREQVNAIIIDNIKSSVEAANQSSVHEQQGYSRAGLKRNRKANAAVGRNVYNYINESKFKAVLATAKKSRKDKAAIAAARQIFIDAIKRSEFAFVMREDFPENDEESHLGYAQIIAEAIQGIGIDESNIGIPDAIWSDYKADQARGMTAKQEFEQSLLPCLSGEKLPEDNWLSKALIGLNLDDNQKMQAAPAYENFARASDFIGTSISWLNTFKNEAKQKAIEAKTAEKIQYLNELASHKARIVQTMSDNMSYIKENNRWLYKMDLWTQASVNQSTGFRLAQKVLKYSPEKATKWLGEFVNNRINKAMSHMVTIPSSIDTGAVKQVSGSGVPFAVDFMHSLDKNQQALDIYNKAAGGDKNAQMVVTIYTDKATADSAASVNQSIADGQTDLNKFVDSNSGTQRQLERSSAGKAALVAVGVGLFQLRSVWMGKSRFSEMADRGDLMALEFMTSYASTSLALTGAALDVAAAGMQIRGASTAAIARISLGVGVLGAVGAGFEVYSLNISRERYIENKSGISRRTTSIAMISAGAAGVASLAIGLGFVMPWVIGIVAVAWAVSLIAQWIAFTYDKSHILPIHYWLDAGVFGNKAMLNSEYLNNPFQIQAMGSLEQDMHAYSLALTEIQVNPRFATSTADFRQTLSGQIEVTLSQWNDDSEIVVEFIGISSQERGLDRKSFNIKTLKRQNKAVETSKVLQVTLDIPKTSHFQAHYLGSYQAGTRNPNEVQKMQEAKEIAQANAGREIDKLRAVVKYALNPSKNPYYQLRTSVTSQ
ncbi:hypothetical protein I6E84_04400 [Psychrobacter sp. SCQQ22]|uniref:toxin VasX n=1 Tax=Psychrobacter sp. SCQQ22 TaxID=2792059 RepID=UPI0018CCAC7D|nr:toxin VasX [Psychrobacter sp. SCQQ22]MBH0085456.1 hypothetical protein [Psychrobacter sp. SCQQ22]